jgi:hypothetical protein
MFANKSKHNYLNLEMGFRLFLIQLMVSMFSKLKNRFILKNAHKWTKCLDLLKRPCKTVAKYYIGSKPLINQSNKYQYC